MPLAESVTTSKNEAPARPWRVGTTAIALAVLALLAKALGFAEKVVIAHYFGTTPSADTYFAMTSILFSAVFLIKELVYPTLMPTLNQARTVSPGVFNDLFGRVLRGTFFVVLAGAIIGAVLMGPIAELLVPGFSAAQKEQLTRLLRELLPAGVLMGLIAVTYTTLNARGRLVVSSVADALFKTVILFGVAAMIPVLGLHAVPAAMLTAAIVCLGLHLLVLRCPAIVTPRDTKHGGILLKRMLALMAPIVLAVVFSHISDLVDNLLASGLPSGQLSYLGYGKRITDAILLAGPIALATVLYARASRLAALSRHEEFANLIGKGMRLLLFLSIPIACLMIEFRHPVVKVLFQHGNFDPSSTAGVGGTLVVYGLGIVMLSLEGLCVYSFYSLSDTRTPVVAGILCVLLNIAIAVLLVGPMAYLGIAAALVIAKSVKVMALLTMLRRRLGRTLLGERAYLFGIRLVVATFALWIVVRVLSGWISGDGVMLILWLAICGFAAIAFYLVTGHLLGLNEPRLLINAVPWRRFVALGKGSY